MTESMTGFMTGMALHKKSMTGSRVALSCTVSVPSGSKSGPAFGGQGANRKSQELNPPTEHRKQIIRRQIGKQVPRTFGWLQGAESPW